MQKSEARATLQGMASKRASKGSKGKKPRERSGCPCGGAGYETCCAPLHEGGVAEDAETLMRSRYSAFALGKLDYLWRTLHSAHDDREMDEATWRETIERSVEGRTYTGLKILETRAPGDDGIARVLFVAKMRDSSGTHEFCELSYFLQEADEWRYLTGVIAGGASERTIDALER